MDAETAQPKSEIMTESLFSTYWYRVADLRPALRATVTVSRHVYRGEPWYILRNNLDGRHHRFNAAAFRLIGQMDGKRTVQEIWDNALSLSMDQCPSQDELIRLLYQLHSADLIQNDIFPVDGEQIKKGGDRIRPGWFKRISNPFYLRFPLWDPDRFLTKWSFVTYPLFTSPAFILWAVFVLVAAVAAGLHHAELTNNVTERLLLPSNLILIYLTYPAVKLLHEFGHAFAVKRWGGEVHELGIILLAFTPIPYVDATSSVAFSEKRHRIVVAAMGMMIELFLASFALFIWLNVEAGVIRTLAFVIMLVGGVSTLLFNGNPLLRYDGYYILTDLIEIPNLSQRSVRYMVYLVQRYLLGIRTAESPVTAQGERIWFLLYGPLSCIYRILVVIALSWMVSGYFFLPGVLIAIWGVMSLLVLPVLRGMYRLLDDPEVRRRRFRLVSLGAGGCMLLVMFLFVLPMPLWTTAQGVVWLSDQSVIRAGTDCEIQEILVPVGKVVRAGTPVLRGGDPLLRAEMAVKQAHLQELYAAYHALPLYERVKRRILMEKIQVVRADIESTEERLGKLTIRSPATGRFILVNARSLLGRFVRRGQLLGYIVTDQCPTIRVVVSQNDINLIRNQVSGVEVVLSERISHPIKARIKRFVPEATFHLPSPVLGTAGGGPVPVDPADPDGENALASFFQLDVTLPLPVENPHIGERVYVRFDCGTMPVAMQLYRTLRQLFLKRFYV